MENTEVIRLIRNLEEFSNNSDCEAFNHVF